MENQIPHDQVTLLLRAGARGEPGCAERLLPLVYEELRRIARARMSNLPQGQTLQPTALVHEAYMRLVGDEMPSWESRAHFFGAAARSMRDILVDQSRRRSALKRGGGLERDALRPDEIAVRADPDDILAVNEALSRLEQRDARKAQIVNLRYFAGLSAAETAAAMDLSVPTIEREWRYIKAWFRTEFASEGLSDA